jgi:cell wall-associated NlpC family hydrolase
LRFNTLSRGRRTGLAGLLFAGTLLAAVPAAAQTGGAAPPGSTSTTETTTTEPAPSGTTATFNPDGSATAPAGAPRPVRKAINAANRIRTKPYIWGGGHAKWKSKGYDCSGAVSYVLHAAGQLKRPMVSGALGSRWGVPGYGSWITVFGNRSHVYMVIAGLRFDTSSGGDYYNQGSGPRWRTTARAATGYSARFAPGL